MTTCSPRSDRHCQILSRLLRQGLATVALAASTGLVASAHADPANTPLKTISSLSRTAGDGGVLRSERSYPLPVVSLLDGSGKAKPLRTLLDDGRPVVMTFFYSSCTSVCPVTSQVLAEFSRLMGSDATRVNVVTVSIDPDHDTVKQLNEHARKRGLSGAFYTGDPAASETVQRAFEAWRGDKMNHEPVIFLRGSSRSTWVRLDGLVSPQRLLHEFRHLQAS